MRHANLLACLVAFLLAAPAVASLNNSWPRSRTFSEIGRDAFGTNQGSPATRARARAASGTNRDFTRPDAYDTTAFRAGGHVGYASDYVWRDFLITDSDMNATAEVYASFFGVEASVWALSDTKDSLKAGDPLNVDYRISYTHKLANSLTTVAFTRQSWPDSAGKIGFKNQGFATGSPVWEEDSNELSLHSYWFSEQIQTYNMNYFLGGDALVWIDEPGFRGSITAGVFANKPPAQAEQAFLPNCARLQATIIFQSDYHTEGSSIPGGDIFGEVWWDLREYAFPGMIVAGLQYYLPIDKDPRDAIVFTMRFEVTF